MENNQTKGYKLTIELTSREFTVEEVNRLYFILSQHDGVEIYPENVVLSTKIKELDVQFEDWAKAKKIDKSKPIQLNPCDKCGTLTVNEPRPDPYAEEMSNDKTEYILCDRCYLTSCEEI